MAEELRAKLIVDTAGFKSDMNNAAASVEDFNARAKRATEEYNAAAAKGGEAAKALGKAFDEASASGANYVEAQEQAVAATRGLAEAEEEETESLKRNISARMAATAELRVFEGGVQGSTRAAGALLAIIPGLGEAMQLAFPVFGAIALVEIMTQLGGKVLDVARAFDVVAQAEAKAAREAEGVQRAMETATEHTERAMRRYIEASQGKVGLLKYDLEHLKLTVNSDDITKITDAQREIDSLRKRASATESISQSAFSSGATASFRPTEDAIAATKELSNAETRLKALQQERIANTLNAKSTQIDLGKAEDKEDAKSSKDDDKAARAELQAIEEEFSRLNAAKANITGHPLTASEAEAFWSQYLTTFHARSTEAKKVLDEFSKYQSEIHKQIVDFAANVKSVQADVAGLGDGSAEADRGIKAINTQLRTQAEDATRTGERWNQYNAQVAKGQEIAASAARALELEGLQIRFADGAISALSLSQSVGAIHTAEYTAKIAALRKELKALEDEGKDLKPGDKNYSQNSAQQQQVRNQITQVQGQGELSGTKDTANLANQIAKPYLTATSTIEGAFESMQSKLLTSHRSFSQIMGQLEGEWALKAIQGVEHWGMRLLEQEILTTAQHAASTQAKVAADAAGTAESSAIAATGAIEQGVHAASLAAKNTYAQVAGWPVVGPIIAPVAAAAAFVAVASFDVGTNYIPQDMIAQVHAGERIIPAADNREIMSALGSSSTGKPAQNFHTNLTYHSHGGGTQTDARQMMKIATREINHRMARS